MQNVNDPRWDGNRLHNLHQQEGVVVDGDCPVCAGFVTPYKTPEDSVGKNRHRTMHTTTDKKPPGNPPAPPPGKLDAYKREETVNDAEAVAAFQMVSTVQNRGFTDRAFDILEAWVINKRGDSNLAWGLNWDGTRVSEPKTPPCPDWSRCSNSKDHWGPCIPYIPWSERNPTGHTNPNAAAHSPRYTRLADGGALVNGIAHSKDCECAAICVTLRAAEKAGRHAAANNGVTDHHPNAYSTPAEKIDAVTADEAGLYTKYYEITGSESCGHVWVARLVDRVWCHTCDKRPVNYEFKLIPMAVLDPRVTAYRTARSAERTRLANTL